jgi:hypothetical protein
MEACILVKFGQVRRLCLFVINLLIELQVIPSFPIGLGQCSVEQEPLNGGKMS